MDPITIGILIMIGCGLFLAGCTAHEEENNENFSLWEPIPEDMIEAHLGDDDDSPANNNMELKCTCSEGNVTTLKSASGYSAQGGIMGTDVDIEFESFIRCDTSIDHICKPEIEGSTWKCADENHTSNSHHQVTCDAFMFCRYGVGIVYITDAGQIQGKEYLRNYVVETVTGARLILDSNINPQGIPLYSGPTMNGAYASTDLRGVASAKYAAAAISTDNVYMPKAGYYKFVHAAFMNLSEAEKELIKETYNPEYHGSFHSKNNEFSTADNRIEVALREDILCKDGEEFSYYLGGKYVDIILSDGTTLACIVGDAKGNEVGSSEDGATHYDGSIVEIMGINNDNFAIDEEKNCNRFDLLHGEDIIEIRVYSDKKLYTDEDQYVYYFSDYNGDMNVQDQEEEN